MMNRIPMFLMTLALGCAVSKAHEPGHAFDGHHGRGRMECGIRPDGFGHGGMMGEEMVSSPDGGVIVLRGGKLYKYDKDLNLKKEIELPRPPGWDSSKVGMRMMKRPHGHWHQNDSAASGDSSKK